MNARQNSHGGGFTHFLGCSEVGKFFHSGNVMKFVLLTMAMAVGMVAGCRQNVETVSEKFNELPASVQKTARAQAPNDEITAVSQKTQDGKQVYEIEFREQDRHPKVVVAADGTLLNSEFAKTANALERVLTPTGGTGTPLSALPEAVQKTILSKAPNGAISSITRHENNGRVIYEVSFQDAGRNPALQVADDGTLVQSLQK